MASPARKLQIQSASIEELSVLEPLLSQYFEIQDILQDKNYFQNIHDRWSRIRVLLNESEASVVDSYNGEDSFNENKWRDLSTLLQEKLCTHRPYAIAEVTLIIENKKFAEEDLFVWKPGNSLGKLATLLKTLADKWALLRKNGVVPDGDSISKAIAKLSVINIKELAKKNHSLRYLINIQNSLEIMDICRLIQEQTKTEENPFIRILEANFKHLHEFVLEQKAEMLQKFSFFSSKTPTNDEYVKVCDFIILLRTIFQDTTSVRLYLGNDQSMTLFQNCTSGKKIFTEIYNYFYQELKINPNLPGNERHNLKMDFELFVSVLNYLLMKGIIVWQSDKKPEPEAPQRPPSQLAKLQKQASATIDAPANLSPAVIGDTSLEFKIINMLGEIRLSLDNTQIALERDICSKIATILSEQLSRLQLFEKFFNNKINIGNMSSDIKKKIETMFYTISSNSFFKHYGFKNEYMDYEKYSSMLDLMEVNKMLPAFIGKKQLKVMYLRQIEDTGKQLSLSHLEAILLYIVEKIVESNSNMNFDTTLNKLVDNFFKNNKDTQERQKLFLKRPRADSKVRLGLEFLTKDHHSGSTQVLNSKDPKPRKPLNFLSKYNQSELLDLKSVIVPDKPSILISNRTPSNKYKGYFESIVFKPKESKTPTRRKQSNPNLAKPTNHSPIHNSSNQGHNYSISNPVPNLNMGSLQHLKFHQKHNSQSNQAHHNSQHQDSYSHNSQNHSNQEHSQSSSRLHPLTTPRKRISINLNIVGEKHAFLAHPSTLKSQLNKAKILKVFTIDK